MKTIEEIIHDTVEQSVPNSSPNEKAEYETNLRKIVVEGVSPKDVLNIGSDFINAIYTQGYNLYNSGHYLESELLFSYLCQLDGTKPAQLMGLASSYHMQKKYQEAMNAYLCAFYLDPSNPLPFFHISDCYIKINDIYHAILSLSFVVFQAGSIPEFAKIKERALMTQQALLNKYHEAMPTAEKVQEQVKETR